jgi:hypothetical protein
MNDKRRTKAYKNNNLPPDLNSALERIQKNKEAVVLIDGRLAKAKIIIDDRNIPWEDPIKKEKIVWRALSVDTKDSKSLLVASRNVLKKMASEGVKLQPDEQQLVDMIGEHLGLT